WPCLRQTRPGETSERSHPRNRGERFPAIAATHEHLDRCDYQIALLTVGTRTRDAGMGERPADDPTTERRAWPSESQGSESLSAASLEDECQLGDLPAALG